MKCVEGEAEEDSAVTNPGIQIYFVNIIKVSHKGDAS